MGGEKIVLRLIDNSKLGKGLEELGYTKKMLALYRPIVEAPYGLLLQSARPAAARRRALRDHHLAQPARGEQSIPSRIPAITTSPAVTIRR